MLIFICKLYLKFTNYFLKKYTFYFLIKINIVPIKGIFAC